MDLDSKNVLGTSVDLRKLHLNRIYKDIGEILLRVKDLSEINNAAEIFDYSRRIELEMTNFEKTTRINSENKLAKNVLIKEVSGIEKDIETLKIEFCAISSRLSDLIKEKNYLEYELKKLNIRYKKTNLELNEIKGNLIARYEELKEHTKINDYKRKEVEDLELAITLEENAISEKKKELKNLEMSNIKEEIEKRKLDKLTSQALIELNRKVKMRELIEEKVNNSSRYPTPTKVQCVSNRGRCLSKEDIKNKISNGRVKLCNTFQNVKIKKIA